METTRTAPTSTLAAVSPAGTDLERSLAEAEALRLTQLDLMPPSEDDPVAAVQRAALTQTLEAIAAARVRLADGTFGACTRCRRAISPERLALRPWAATCVDCARR